MHNFCYQTFHRNLNSTESISYFFFHIFLLQQPNANPILKPSFRITPENTRYCIFPTTNFGYKRTSGGKSLKMPRPQKMEIREKPKEMKNNNPSASKRKQKKKTLINVPKKMLLRRISPQKGASNRTNGVDQAQIYLSTPPPQNPSSDFLTMDGW